LLIFVEIFVIPQLRLVSEIKFDFLVELLIDFDSEVVVV